MVAVAPFARTCFLKFICQLDGESIHFTGNLRLILILGRNI